MCEKATSWGAEVVWESRKVVRAFSSWAVGALGCDSAGVAVGGVVIVVGSSGIWTLILRMNSSWS